MLSRNYYCSFTFDFPDEGPGFCTECGGVHAAYINSSLTEGQYRKAMELAARGRYKIIYVAPERLMTPSFLDLSRQVEISMIAVDEAHCISQWGQDFRPSYLKIVDFIQTLPARPVIGAYTATVTKAVRGYSLYSGA